MKSHPSGKSFREDQFLTGSRFEEAVQLYVFDKKLRLLALDALERIEMAVRVDVAHLIGQYGALSYTDNRTFDANFVNKRQPHFRYQTSLKFWTKKFEGLVKRSRKHDFVSHNLTKYGELPIWVAIEIFDFGCLSLLYSGLKFRDREIVAQKYGLGAVEFASLIRSLSYIRNVAAHHSRLWNLNVVESSTDLKLGADWSGLDRKRPYFYFAAMQLMLGKICSNSGWGARFQDLVDDFPHISVATACIGDFGIPPASHIPNNLWPDQSPPPQTP